MSVVSPQCLHMSMGVWLRPTNLDNFFKRDKARTKVGLSRQMRDSWKVGLSFRWYQFYFLANSRDHDGSDYPQCNVRRRSTNINSVQFCSAFVQNSGTFK